VFGHHVFDADEAGVFLGGVVDEALAEVFADVGAVVVCLDEAGAALAGVSGVDVEGVEKLADVG